MPAVTLALSLILCPVVQAVTPDVDMAEVRRLAREPVETILSGAHIGRVSDADYWTTVQGSSIPVVMIFCANQDEWSRNLATLARYLAFEFSDVIGFYGYRVTAGSTMPPDALVAIGTTPSRAPRSTGRSGRAASAR